MNTRGLLVTIFAVALGVAPQLVSTSSAGRNIFCHADFAEGWAGSLPWAEDHGRMEVNASSHRSDGMREGSLAVAGWRENLHIMHYANTAPEG